METDLALAAGNGVANFKGCNIHDNIADQYVCSHLELSLSPYGCGA
jgi:hypothetical protein